MPHLPKFSDAFVNAMLAAGLTTLDNGYLDVYDGVKPADPSVAITTQVRLARLRFANPGAPYPVGGISPSYAFTSDNDTVAGTPTWFRMSTAVPAAQIDGTVGLADADLVLNSVTFLAHGDLDVPSITFTQPKG